MEQKIISNEEALIRLKKNVGGKFRQKRQEKNYTIKAVAKDLGYSQSTLCEIENGKHFNLEIITKLANYFCIPLDEVLYSPNKDELPQPRK